MQKEIHGVINSKGETRPILPTDGEIATMGTSGDVKTIWDRTKPDEVDNARSTFDNLRKKGYLAFKVDSKGEKGEQIDKFDPAAEKMIMVPPMMGG